MKVEKFAWRKNVVVGGREGECLGGGFIGFTQIRTEWQENRELNGMESPIE